MNKHKVMATPEQRPNECSTEEIIEKFLFAEKVEPALKDVAEGKFYLSRIRERTNSYLVVKI